jgi:predicted metalloprotease with PDZ domain
MRLALVAIVTAFAGCVVASCAMPSCAMPGSAAPDGTANGHDVLADADIAYEVELASVHPALVRCELDLAGDDDGVTAFSLDDDWGGAKDTIAALSPVTVEDASGASVVLEHPSSHEWRAHHVGGAHLRVRWEIPANANQEITGSSGHRCAIVNERLVHFIGHNALVYPTKSPTGSATKSDDGTPRRIRFTWSGFDRAGWKTACSFGSSTSIAVRETLEAFRHAVFLAAPDLRVLQRNVRGRHLEIAIDGSWNVPDDELAGEVESILRLEREFFHDDAFPHFLVSWIPVGRPDPHSSVLGGTGLTQSFALFVLAGSDLSAEGRDRIGIPHLLAHEMFHAWNGGVLRMADPEPLVYWFSEGFTDFYARRLLYRAGLMDTGRYAEDVNKRLARFWSNPASRAPAERIRAEFWKDGDVQRLPYERGDVMAFLIDREIRVRSNGARSIDDLVCEMVEEGRAGREASNAWILARIAAATSVEFAERVKRTVVDGEMPELPSDLLAPALDLENVPIPAWDAGFDVDASEKEHVVHGVREGSNAWKARLRDGQTIESWSLYSGNVTRPLECKVRDARGEHALTWLPHGESVVTPQVRVRPGSAEHGAAPL